LMMASE